MVRVQGTVSSSMHSFHFQPTPRHASEGIAALPSHGRYAVIGDRKTPPCRLHSQSWVTSDSTQSATRQCVQSKLSQWWSQRLKSANASVHQVAISDLPFQFAHQSRFWCIRLFCRNYVRVRSALLPWVSGLRSRRTPFDLVTKTGFCPW